MASTIHGEAATPYEYHALETVVHIRIMLLQPALDTTAPIHFSFVEDHYFDLEGQYEALSYTWGEPKLTHPVHVEGGQLLFVTENLDQALRRLRRTSETRWLWADAVCINQSDDEEKASQIPLMVDIFRGAKRVVAWLGPGSERLEKCILDLGALSRLPRDALDFQMRRIADKRMHSRERAWARMSDSILDLLSLPWFNRLWIVQEVVFNVDVILICGAFELPWTRLIAAVSIFRNTVTWDPSSAERGKTDAVQIISKLWRHHCFIEGNLTSLPQPQAETSGKRENDIIELIEQFSEYGCTDPRDRIFALYSMTQDIVPIQFADLPESKDAVIMDIDYSLDVRQTYQVFAVACMKSGRADTLLSAVISRLYTPVAQDWSSWIPDFRKQARKPDLVPMDISGASMEYIPPNKAFLVMPTWTLHTTPSHGPTVEHVFSFQRTMNRSDYYTKLHALHLDHQPKRYLAPGAMLDFVRSIMSPALCTSSTVVPEPATSASTTSNPFCSLPTECPPVSEEPAETRDYDFIFNITFRLTEPTTVFGHANVPPRHGDKIFVLSFSYPLDRRGLQVANVLILRPTHSQVRRPVDNHPFDTFRLIGSAFLLIDGIFFDYYDSIYSSTQERISFVLE